MNEPVEVSAQPLTGAAPRRRRWVKRLLIGLLLVVCVHPANPCGGPFGLLAPRFIDRTARRPAQAPSARRRAPHRVILIAFDGLASWVLEGTDTPNFDALMSVSRVATRAISHETATMEAHASMISGVPSSVHGMTGPGYKPWIRFRSPTLWDLCGEHELRCGLFATKSKLGALADGQMGLERYELADGWDGAFASSLDFIRERDPDLVMVTIGRIDGFGHWRGWGSPEQREALVQLDAGLGTFLADALQAAPDRPLVALVTADHGGSGNSHYTSTMDRVARVPWILFVQGTPPGTIEEEVDLMDVAPTIAELLDVPAPAIWQGRSRASVRRDSVRRD